MDKIEFADLAIREYLKKIRVDLANVESERNPKQIEKLLKLSELAKRIEEENDCEITHTNISPAWNQAGIEILFYGQIEAKRHLIDLLIECMNLADGMNISVNPMGDDYVQITFFVENLWKTKNGKDLRN